MTGVRLRGAGSDKPTPWLRKVFEQMKRDGFVPDRKWALDLGAGNGRNSEWLYQQGMTSHSCDPMPAGPNVYEWNGRGWPPHAIPHGYDVILLQYVLMFTPVANLRALRSIVNAAARFNCVLILEAYNAKTGFYHRQMLHDFVQMLNEYVTDSHVPCQWVQRMADGSDHLAFQLVAKPSCIRGEPCLNLK